jgi:hypothetical protein
MVTSAAVKDERREVPRARQRMAKVGLNAASIERFLDDVVEVDWPRWPEFQRHGSGGIGKDGLCSLASRPGRLKALSSYGRLETRPAHSPRGLHRLRHRHLPWGLPRPLPGERGVARARRRLPRRILGPSLLRRRRGLPRRGRCGAGCHSGPTEHRQRFDRRRHQGQVRLTMSAQEPPIQESPRSWCA